ncbi:HEPN domain-containing protein [Methanimicrococcus hacksteinii]|uniref:HEPN domain-containing protein n=1 Tax=Methanimicrococcus hacksteinii TaxID=3028293 RepID=UPI00298F2601|nr:HEPN domain-containing protein [Methanimicrococcus sp. At1]
MIKKPKSGGPSAADKLTIFLNELPKDFQKKIRYKDGNIFDLKDAFVDDLIPTRDFYIHGLKEDKKKIKTVSELSQVNDILNLTTDYLLLKNTHINPDLIQSKLELRYNYLITEEDSEI